VDAAVSHVDALDDRIAYRSTALDNPSARVAWRPGAALPSDDPEIFPRAVEPPLSTLTLWRNASTTFLYSRVPSREQRSAEVFLFSHQTTKNLDCVSVRPYSKQEVP
jgi:hypothetical protein